MSYTMSAGVLPFIMAGLAGSPPTIFVLFICLRFFPEHTQSFIQYVDRGILIPVDDIAASALIDTVFERRLISCAAAGADLRGRIPLIHLNQQMSPFPQLIPQHVQKHPVTVVHCSFSVPESFIGHCPHIQIFHTDYVMLIGYLS